MSVMVTETEATKELLMRENHDFRELVRLHHDYEERLSELASLTYPNDEELLEESTLKKKKLAIKDQIYSMLQAHTSETGH